MSVDRPCECGAIIPAYVLGCQACGKKYKVRDEFLVGQDILPEPPVGIWAQQYQESKQSKSFFTKHSLKRSQRGGRRRKSAKEFLIIFLIFVFGFYLVSNLLGNSNAMSEIMFKIKTTSVQVLPKSDAYQLGFDAGNEDRVKDEAGKALFDQLASYGYVDVQNIDEQIKLCGTPDTLWNEEDCSYLITTNSPEYKRKIYRQYAETLWKIVGLLNSLENTQKNKGDFISGFLAGKFR